MVNFLTSEFLWREKLRKIILLILIIVLAILAIITNYLLNLHLENKEMKLQIEAVDERIELMEAKTSEIDDFKAEKQKLTEELEAKKELTTENLSAKLLMEQLARLNLSGLYFEQFELDEQNFEIFGITKEFIYLTQLIKQFEAEDFFQSYHLENTAENNGLISFNIRGEIRKGLEYD